MKKQFKGGAEEPGVHGGVKAAGATAIAATGEEGAKASRSGSTEKDEEMVKLRKQLAQSKLEKGAVAATAKKGSSTVKGAKKT